MAGLKQNERVAFKAINPRAVFTLITPLEEQPGKFRRRILGETELKILLDRWFKLPGGSKRFYVEAHNGVDNEAIIGNWPKGFYS